MSDPIIPCEECGDAQFEDGAWRCYCSKRKYGRCNCEEAQHMADRLGVNEKETWAPCIVQGNEYAEYCRENCPRYGTGTCVYDPETKRNMVKTGGY